MRATDSNVPKNTNINIQDILVPGGSIYFDGKSLKNADIVLDTHTTEDLMKRLFHTMRVDQTMPDTTNLDKYFEITETIDKKFKRPEIVRSNKKGARDTRVTQTNRQDFESQIRSTQRDRKYYKVLLINLGNGVFPKFDNLI